MEPILKSDLINGAYSRARISGLTVTPGAEDVELALDLLESMMSEWDSRGYCIGYKQADPEYKPDPADPSGVNRQYKYAVETALAVRIMDDFGKPVPPGLQRNHSTSFSALASNVAIQEQVPYPNTMPRGSYYELRNNRWQRYFRRNEEAPKSCDTNYMDVGEIQSYTESYVAYLNDGEIISSYTIEAGSGITVLSDALNTAANILSYTIEATGGGDEGNAYVQIKITAITDAGRIDIRFVDFQLEDKDV